MEYRDAPEDVPGRPGEDRSSAGRRFARLVESPASRRVVLPRLIVAGGLTLSLSTLVVVGVSKLLQSAAGWVDRRPEHLIRFAEIELVPPPDPWIRGGASHFLEGVRKGTAFGDSISLLDLHLKGLENDFRRYPWVKDVLQVDRSHHGRLIVHLVYRKPVAVVPFRKAVPFAFVLDEEAVVLPDREILWTSNTGPYLIRGMMSPLVEILDLPDSSPPPTLGLPWKRKVEDGSLGDRDPFVLKAARIAQFLRERTSSPGSRREAPDFVSIHLPAGPVEPFFLYDSGKNLVCWGSAPGEEKPGEPSAETRWTMLLDWARSHGPLDAKPPKYLYFTGDGARIGKSRDRR